MRLGTAMERLFDNYAYASDKEWIHDKVAWALYHTWKEADDRKTEPSGYKMKPVEQTEPQTETEIAKAIVHKMIDDAVIAEDAYPDLRQKMHDAVDEYDPQTDADQQAQHIESVKDETGRWVRVGQWEWEHHTDTTHFGKAKGESITTNKVEDKPQTEREGE